jgi:hypothetical protein
MMSEEYQAEAEKLKDISDGDSIEAQRSAQAAVQQIGNYAAAEERRKDDRKEAMENLRYSVASVGSEVNDVDVARIAVAVEGVALADSEKNKNPGHNWTSRYFSAERLFVYIMLGVVGILVLAWLVWMTVSQ